MTGSLPLAALWATGMTKGGRRSGIRDDADGLFRIRKIQVRTVRMRFAFWGVATPPAKSGRRLPRVDEALA